MGLSFLATVPRLVVQAFQLVVLVQAELLVWLQPAQLVMGRMRRRDRAHIVLTIRTPSGTAAADVGGSAVQTVLQMLRGMDWESRAAAKQHQLTGRAINLGPGKTPWRLPPHGERLLTPLEGFRVTHAHTTIRSGHEVGVFKAWYLTGRIIKWADTVELTLHPTPGRSQR